jgi:AcrR family transcriptional regulator
MNTKKKIILTSLDLFNSRGERNVSTNHIAAHLGISPGNLYYHFRNKTDIIYEIFLQYQNLVDGYLQMPDKRSLTVEDQFSYLEAVFDGFWNYRFFHRDLEHFLDCDPRLQSEYKVFIEACLEGIFNILKGLEVSAILRPMQEGMRRTFALNTWLIVTGWMSYLKTVAGCEVGLIKKDSLMQGIYQVISLEIPFLKPEVLPLAIELQRHYKPPVSVAAQLSEGLGRVSV